MSGFWKPLEYDLVWGHMLTGEAEGAHYDGAWESLTPISLVPRQNVCIHKVSVCYLW